MSNAAPQASEPTMEEILASIRRIISEEETAPALKPDGDEAAPGAADEPDVFELTDVVETEAAPPPPAARPRPSLVEPADVAFEPEPAAEPLVAAQPEEEGLVETAVIDRAASAFAALHRNVEVASTPGGNTLEGMVREMMRPMLKQWLNDHLPALVENVVREEVERVANRRR